MDNNTSDERARFEAWARAQPSRYEHFNGGFDYPLGNALWDAWQARAALATPPAVSEASDTAAQAVGNIYSRAGKNVVSLNEAGRALPDGASVYANRPTAPAVGAPVAWLTEDGERVVTEKTMAGTRKDGGAILSSLKVYSVPAYSTQPAASVPAVGAPVADYSEMSREQLERHAARMAQALADDRARKFHEKHAFGPMMTPSCLCCGKLPEQVAIKHAELPGIVICEACRTAAAPPTASVREQEDGTVSITQIAQWQADSERLRAAQPPSAQGKQYPLPDDLYPGSKDWAASNYAGRVEWLHVMYESAKRTVAMLEQRAEPQGLEAKVHELTVSMRHSAGTWMVPGWDGNKVANLLEAIESALAARDSAGKESGND